MISVRCGSSVVCAILIVTLIPALGRTEAEAGDCASGSGRSRLSDGPRRFARDLRLRCERLFADRACQLFRVHLTSHSWEGLRSRA